MGPGLLWFGLLWLVLFLAASSGFGAESILPASEIQGWAIINPDGPGFVQMGDVNVPEDCGSVNLGLSYPGYNPTTWTVTSAVGSGSVVHVGRTWTVTVEIKRFPLTGGGNDGIHPLHVSVPPVGPASSGAVPSGQILGGDFYYPGDDPVGLIGPLGNWGFTYDVNSEPTIFGNPASDGTWVVLEVAVTASAPGLITMPAVNVEGYDNSVLEGEVACSMNVGFQWTVVDPQPLVVGPDQASTDARYANTVLGDANEGPHTVEIDVLANDDDPNVGGGPGDLSQVRIQDWSPTSAKGGAVSCGSPAQKNPSSGTPLANLSAGPCLYTPPVGVSGPDSFTYKVRGATDSEAHGSGVVTIQVDPNQRPEAGSPSFGTATGEDKLLDLNPYLVDPDGDALTCFADVAAAPGGVGIATVNPNCTVDWDNTNPGFLGNVSFGYRVCDTHVTLQGASLGVAATRAAGYSDGDLSESTSRRCTLGQATIAILSGLKLPPTGVPDTDVVDAGYAADGIGPYRLSIPVLDNDTDGNGPNPTMPSAAPSVIESPEVDEGTASFDAAGNLSFVPADGFSGYVSLKYRVCEDPSTQAPPYEDDPKTPLIDEGLPFCGVATVGIEVIGNAPPIAAPDETSIAHSSLLVGFDVAANDVDPEGEGLTCVPGSLLVSDPGLVELASLSVGCGLNVNPTDGAMGTIVFTYEVCDAHSLATPTHPAVPYGEDGRVPGQAAPRCSFGEATVHVVMQDDEQAPDPLDGDPPPVCVDDVVFSDSGEPVSIDVLANDWDLDGDDNPAPVILVAPPMDEPATTALGGSAAMEGPTSVLYVPPDSGETSDSFVYFARDEIGQPCEGTVTVHRSVLAVPGPNGRSLLLLMALMALLGLVTLQRRL